jgi:predicted CoA-binding protein
MKPPTGDPGMDGFQELQSLLDESGDRDNPGPEELKKLMESVRSIAVVGISRNPEKPARRVPAYLAAKGYDVTPVNPFVDEVLGKTAKDSLEDVSEPVDMVLVFRPSEDAAKIAETAMRRDERPVIWLQKGIRADEVAATARDLGFTVVQDLCAYEVHKALNPV